MNIRKALKKPYNRKRILAALLMAALVVSDYQPAAASAADKAKEAADAIDKAQENLDEAQENLDEVNQQIQDIQTAQSRLLSEMASYDNQLMSLLTDIEILTSDMEMQELDIEQANADLEVARLEEQQQYEGMKLRIQYMYENGEKSFWTAIIGAESMTDLLNRVEYVSDVYAYDRQMLSDYQAIVQEVENLTVELAAEMAEMEELQLSYEEQQSYLEQVIAEKGAKIADFDSQLSAAQTLASQYAQTIRQQNQIIAEEQEKKAAAEAEAAAEAAAAAKKNSSTEQTASSETTETGSTASGSTAASGSTTTGSTADSSESGSSSSTSGLTDSGLNPSYTTGVSGSDVVAYASQFLGNPYVLGGTSLTEGTDCSYFVMAVYAHFGISLPRSSYAQRSCGQEVSYENAQPGDIICYPGHVAIYIGNGKIIHASNPTTGICYGSATYRTITTVRRVL